MKVILLLVLVAIAMFSIPAAYSTHISQPILTIEQNLVYTIGDNLAITGWVEYDDEATSDVLLSVKISNPSGVVTSEFFLTSDADGKFEFPFELAESDGAGDYKVNIMSMCLEVHRDICTHKTAETTISVIGEQSKIPDWVRNVFVWYAEESISEAELIQAIQFLVNERIIILDPLSIIIE